MRIREHGDQLKVHFDTWSWMGGVPMLGVAAFTGWWAYQLRAEDPNAAVALVCMTAVELVLVAVAPRSSVLRLTSDRLSWTKVYQSKSVRRDRITGVEIRRGHDGAFPIDWLVVITPEKVHNTLGVRTGSKGATQLEQAVDALQRRLGVASEPDWEALERIRCPANSGLNIAYRSFVAALWVVGVLAFISAMLPVTIACGLTFLVAAVMVQPLLPGGPRLIVEHGVIREHGKSVGIPLSSIREFRVRRLEQMLAAAQLVAATDSGEVAYRHMRVTRGHVEELEELAAMLNARLLRPE